MSKESSEKLMDEIRDISNYLGDRFFGYEWSSNGVSEKDVSEGLENNIEQKTLKSLCNLVLSVNPSDYSANIALGSIHSYNKKYSEAIKFIKKGLQENTEEVISENFNHIYVHQLLGNLYQETKEFEKSFKHFLIFTDELNNIGKYIIQKHESNDKQVAEINEEIINKQISNINQYNKTKEEINKLVQEKKFSEAYNILEEIVPEMFNTINKLNTIKNIYELFAIGKAFTNTVQSKNETDNSSLSDI